MRRNPFSVVRNCFTLLLLLFVIAACDTNNPDENDASDIITGLTITPNPTGYAPLTAEIALQTNQPVQVELFIQGRNGALTDVQHRFDGVSDEMTLPIAGLYAGTTEFTLRFFDEQGVSLGQISEEITTDPLSMDMPEVVIDVDNPSSMKPGMNLTGYFGHNGTFRPMKPLIFDAGGDIRWHLDFTNHPILNDLFYDNGPERLANGNFYLADQSAARIVELDLLGNIVNDWDFPGYEFHHHVLEKPNGNFLVTATRLDVATVEDYIIEIDRSSGDIIREWDLNQSLEYGRRVWVSPFVPPDIDWFHGNGLAYDPTDDTVIISGRTQGTVKLTATNEVVWIVAPHLDWGTAGDGTDMNTKLLQPLDANGQPITDSDILDGNTNHPDFEWSWYQHAPELMPDGTLLLFDNGDRRNYAMDQLYSRAVAYRIDETNMTIQQVWSYGKERGEETYSQIVSDVDYHVDEDNIVFMPGAAGRNQGAPYGKVVEVDFNTKNVVFEATMTAPTAQFGITFHRVERLPLYP
ncbi:MAG: aryl-sulfate sulfotransferase [Bacteroidota bacterium]